MRKPPDLRIPRERGWCPREQPEGTGAFQLVRDADRQHLSRCHRRGHPVGQSLVNSAHTSSPIVSRQL